MTPEDVANAGLRQRVVNAQKAVSAALQHALSALNEFGVTADDLTAVVDKRIAQRAMTARKAAEE